MYSRAGSVPPITSTIRSLEARTSSKSPWLRVSTPAISGRIPVDASIAPARSSSSSANAPPTVPRPRSPTLKDVTRGQVVEGLAPHDDAGVAVLAEDHRRPAKRVVVVRHRMTVCARGRDDEHVAGLRVVEHHVADEDVTRLAVHPGHRAQALAAEPVGNFGLVARAVEHRPQVVRHAAVDGDVGANARDLL